MIFDRDMLLRLADKALIVSRNAAKRSPTIANAMRVSYTKTAGQVNINIKIPFYWAKWYVYGRPAVTAKPGKKLVWFKDRREDPRIKGGYPARRRSDVRKLTEKEFYMYLSQRKIHKADRVGPWPGDYFIPEIHMNWGLWAKEQLRGAVREEIRRIFRPLRSIKFVDLPTPGL